VARLARVFYTGDPASPPPELPPVSGESVVTPMLVEYVEHAKETGTSFQRIIERMIVMSDNLPNKLIAVITRSKSTRQRYYQCLLGMAEHMKRKLAHPPLIKTYDTDSGNRDDQYFDRGGIFVLTAQACKGLEFDTVFIADIHEYPYYPKIEETQKKLFYVMVARAREKVYLLKRKDESCPIDAMLPCDPSVLTRWPRDKERIKNERQ
jgi:superfamily I DNA/RNA helicase